MSEPVLHVIARIVAKLGDESELRQVLEGFLEPTRAEPGCRRYDLLLNQDDPTEFLFVEEWDDDAALAAHAASRHIQDGRRRMADLLAVPAEIACLRQIG